MNWEEIDWSILDRLRGGFLAAQTVNTPYWRSRADLANYDFTFGERIGWKWDAVLNELQLRGWTPPAGPVLDWGCGSGVAGRRALSAFGISSTGALRVHDRSSLAQEFAVEAARAIYPGLDAAPYQSGEPIGLLVVSHVLNELDAEGRAEFTSVLNQAAAVIWVEPGTREVSRDLVTWRENLLRDHHVIAPCTHAAACGTLTPGRERDWCHHFARPPAGIQADSNWVRFGQRVGIDLRSLPYAYLVMERTGLRAPPESWPPGAGRVLGRPEHFKPYARVLNCDSSGLAELTIPKRTLPALYKQLDRTRGPLLYQWQRDASGIVQSGHPIIEPNPASNDLR